MPVKGAARVAGLLCVLAGTLLAAQDEPRPVFRTEANYIRVDVRVTSGGTPVPDLQVQDFEVFEDNKLQQIDRLEYVSIGKLPFPVDTRGPSSVSESREAAQDPRARVFVVFLDTLHVEASASRRIRTPLLNSLRRMLGPDDLIAVMTPDMPARDITFGRGADALERLFGRFWGERDVDIRDMTEQSYATCYPANVVDPNTGHAQDEGIAQEMILRRREQRTLDALDDLTQVLRDLREERKAVLVVSDGWRLYGRNDRLAQGTGGTLPDQVGVDPRSGRIGPLNRNTGNGTSVGACEADRQSLAMLDDDRHFRDITDAANRANVSFYPIDPRGLSVFDEQIVPTAGVGVGPSANPTIDGVEDGRRLAARGLALRSMAEWTDGVALVQASDIERGLTRISEDVSSYYLLSYYSSGKLDGKFHAIRVRVKRPGTQVRARRGYLAAKTTDVTRGSEPSTQSAPARSPALQKAIGTLDVFGRDWSLGLSIASAWTQGGEPRVWVVAEVPRRTGLDPWAGGGTAEISLVNETGASVAAGQAVIPGGPGRSVRLLLTSPTLKAGTLRAQARVKATGSSEAASQNVDLVVPPAGSSSGALIFRRGPTTGNRDVVTADLRFRRNERIRLEMPTGSANPGSGTLLDCRGQPIAVPVTVSMREDADGTRWCVAEVVLAPLAAGDYGVDLSAGDDHQVIAFRIVQ